jgi:hypothetical protein
MLSHQSNYEPKLIESDAGSHIKTYRHPHCPGWIIILNNSNIPLATSDTGIKGFFIGDVNFQYVKEVLNSRQKKGPVQVSELFSVVKDICDGNEQCTTWLKLM